MIKQVAVANAFSINMLNHETQMLRFTAISLTDARKLAQHVSLSIIGHKDTAAVFSQQLGITVPMNRVTYLFEPTKASLLVGQLSGNRLPEGITELPSNASIKWWLVTEVKVDEGENIYE